MHDLERLCHLLSFGIRSVNALVGVKTALFIFFLLVSVDICSYFHQSVAQSYSLFSIFL